MSEQKTRVMKALSEAILAEIEGQHFYRMAASSTDDPKGREVFQKLANDEVLHENYLRAHYASFAEAGVPDRSLQLASPEALDSESPIFSDALKERIDKAHFEMTALSVGTQLEMNAIEFYRKAAEQAGDPLMKQFFRELVEWETLHYKALLSQQDELRHDYWSAAGFSPF
jgi:rubrerythrin